MLGWNQGCGDHLRTLCPAVAPAAPPQRSCGAAPHRLDVVQCAPSVEWCECGQPQLWQQRVHMPYIVTRRYLAAAAVRCVVPESQASCVRRTYRRTTAVWASGYPQRPNLTRCSDCLHAAHTTTSFRKGTFAAHLLTCLGSCMELLSWSSLVHRVRRYTGCCEGVGRYRLHRADIHTHATRCGVVRSCGDEQCRHAGMTCGVDTVA